MQRSPVDHLIWNRQVTGTQPVSGGRISRREPDWLPASQDEVEERKAIPCQRQEQRVTSSVTMLLTVSSPRGWCSTVACDRHFVIRVPIVIGKTAAHLVTIGFVHVLERLQHWNHERVRQPGQETHSKPMPPLFLCLRFGSSAG